MKRKIGLKMNKDRYKKRERYKEENEKKEEKLGR